MESIENWAESPVYPGYRYKVTQRGACTVTIHRPVLTPEEQAKRLGQVRTAAEKLLKATIHNKRKVNT